MCKRYLSIEQTDLSSICALSLTESAHGEEEPEGVENGERPLNHQRLAGGLEGTNGGEAEDAHDRQEQNQRQAQEGEHGQSNQTYDETAERVDTVQQRSAVSMETENISRVKLMQSFSHLVLHSSTCRNSSSRQLPPSCTTSHRS
jgi:hypothetical protein